MTGTVRLAEIGVAQPFMFGAFGERQGANYTMYVVWGDPSKTHEELIERMKASDIYGKYRCVDGGGMILVHSERRQVYYWSDSRYGRPTEPWRVHEILKTTYKGHQLFNEEPPPELMPPRSGEIAEEAVAA